MQLLHKVSQRSHKGSQRYCSVCFVVSSFFSTELVPVYRDCANHKNQRHQRSFLWIIIRKSYYCRAPVQRLFILQAQYSINLQDNQTFKK